LLYLRCHTDAKADATVTVDSSKL